MDKYTSWIEHGKEDFYVHVKVINFFVITS